MRDGDAVPEAIEQFLVLAFVKDARLASLDAGRGGTLLVQFGEVAEAEQVHDSGAVEAECCDQCLWVKLVEDVLGVELLLVDVLQCFLEDLLQLVEVWLAFLVRQ